MKTPLSTLMQSSDLGLNGGEPIDLPRPEANLEEAKEELQDATAKKEEEEALNEQVSNSAPDFKYHPVLFLPAQHTNLSVMSF